MNSDLFEIPSSVEGGAIAVKDLMLSTEVFDANYVSSTFELQGACIKLSSDISLDSLQLSGNLNIGINNEMLAANSTVVGSSNKVGIYGYQIISCEYNAIEQTTRVKVEGEINPLIDVFKPKYSLYSTVAALNIGNVISVDFDMNIIKVDNIVPKLTNAKMYFIDYPELGNTGLALGKNSFIYGVDNIAVGSEAFAGGRSCVAAGNYAHAEGKECTAAWGSHVEGCQNEATRECSHNEGRYNINKGIISHSQGGATHISEGCRQATVGGYMALVSSDLAYVWNGAIRYGYQGNPAAQYGITLQYELPDTAIPSSDVEGRAVEYMHSNYALSDMYHSHGFGTYNINPTNCLSGFYIGEKSLYDHIKENCSCNVLSGKIYSKTTTDFETVIYDIAKALGATINE